jgi:hypothetical protein
MTPGKCPNCSATLHDPNANSCAYCGNAFAPTPAKPKTPGEEVSQAVAGLGFLTVMLLIIAGIFWQLGWDKMAIAIGIAWLAIIAGSSFYLLKRYGRRG